jgi:3-hydroxyisobutyrate dehydrogenase
MDAPVSGSVKPAQDGTLVILVGGTDQDYMLAKPILMFWESFHSLWANLVKSSAKLAINYLLGLNLQGLAETIMFAEKRCSKRRHALHHK